MQLTYHVVDVFTAKPLEGNPVAVFLGAEHLSGLLMQKIAKELNLSETVFVLPTSTSGCDARARIFTPTYEMDFAGHPTLGTAYVVREDSSLIQGRPLELVLEERVGPVHITFTDGEKPIVWLEFPPIGRGPSYERTACAQALGLEAEDLLPGVPCQLLTAGNPCIFVALRDKESVDGVMLDSGRFVALHADQEGPVCIFVFTATNEGAYSRMFAPELGIAEDPATGSVTGPLAVFMMEHKLVGHADGTTFISEQGTKLGRRSLLYVRIEGSYGSDGIFVGGQVVPVSRGTMSLGALTKVT